MKTSHALASLEDELTFPIDQDSVIRQVGAVEIEAPDTQETETVSTIIGPVGQETYASADELFTTIIGNVSDEYIGRKFYDDRGGNPSGAALDPRTKPTFRSEEFVVAAEVSACCRPRRGRLHPFSALVVDGMTATDRERS